MYNALGKPTPEYMQSISYCKAPVLVYMLEAYDLLPFHYNLH